jgi:uncharacterized protein (TIGR02147 family)
MNYREFLRDTYHEKKRIHSYYSFRLFSRKAGFRSPNFLKLVMDGQRNLSKESVFKFCRALNLNKQESEYFENLVFFNQSRTLEEKKNLYLTVLMRFRRRSDPKKIEESEYKYYAAWYHPIIRELVTASDFNGDYRRVARLVVPSISAAEARRSVKLLLALGLIHRTDTGLYTNTSPSLSTGAQVRSIAVANYHKAMMQRAADSIERFEAPQRNISAMTIGISSETFQLLLDKVRRLRKELLVIAEADTAPNRVVQINFQAFPVSGQISTRKKRQ